MLQKQGLHFAAAPVVYREGQLLAREVVVPQEVSDEVDAPRVEQFGIQVSHLCFFVARYDKYGGIFICMICADIQDIDQGWWAGCSGRLPYSHQV